MYHFHGFRYLGSSKVLLENGYNIPRPTVEYIYKPYAEEILHVNVVEKFFKIRLSRKL